ncbi:MAG: cytochrome c-type biogenesis protein CcmH [Solirubrobacterales bacterium]|nr:cytochrome c-type biogenesis protein CcmH [Solirubrobacterales bacterium]
MASVSILTTAPVATAAGPAPKASLTDIEYDVMCVACHESLAVAESPQADSERSYIRTLIAQGQDKSQIEHALVAQYGPAVLALPPGHGFNLTVYVLPPALVAAGIALLVVTIPRWRRRARAAAGAASSSGPPLDPADARRLDEDLARYG